MARRSNVDAQRRDPDLVGFPVIEQEEQRSEAMPVRFGGTSVGPTESGIRHVHVLMRAIRSVTVCGV